MADHAGRVALVTGSAGGIGQAIARRLGADGATVILADLLDARETAGCIVSEAVTVQADVSQESGWARIAEAAEPLGGVDIVVNNAAHLSLRDN